MRRYCVFCPIAGGCPAPAGGLSSGMHPPLSSSQSPLRSVSACGENCARSLVPPLPTARGAAGAPFGLGRKENGPYPQGVCRIRKRQSRQRLRNCTVQKKRPLRRAPVQWPSARDGGRRIGASADLGWPSGTLGSSAKSMLPSRGGWGGGRLGARTHLTCFSFTVSRCGAPSISVTSVPLVPPSARSASLRAAMAGVAACTGGRMRASAPTKFRVP